MDLLVIDCVSPFIEFSDLCKSSKICTKELEKCLLWKHEYQNLITQNPHKKTRNTDTLTHWHTHITPGLERQEDPGAHWPDCPVESASCRASERPHLKEYGGDQLRKAPSISLWPSHTHAYLCAHAPAHRCAHTGTHTNTYNQRNTQKTKSCVSSVKKDQWALIKAWMLHFSGGVLWARVTAYWGWSTLFFFRVSLKHNS